eukprot:4334055-Pyramimonas_sp.AAC.1
MVRAPRGALAFRRCRVLGFEGFRVSDLGAWGWCGHGARTAGSSGFSAATMSAVLRASKAATDPASAAAMSAVRPSAAS